MDKIEFEPVEFIAGDYQEFVYHLTDSKGDKVNLEGAHCSIILFRYGDEENAIGEYTGTNDVAASSFTVAIPSSATENLEPGLYIQQAKIYYTGEASKIYRPGQGRVNIRARGLYNN